MWIFNARVYFGFHLSLVGVVLEEVGDIGAGGVSFELGPFGGVVIWELDLVGEWDVFEIACDGSEFALVHFSVESGAFICLEFIQVFEFFFEKSHLCDCS